MANVILQFRVVERIVVKGIHFYKGQGLQFIFFFQGEDYLDYHLSVTYSI